MKQLILVLLAALAATAAGADSLTREQAMARLDFLVGDWSGGGWILGRDGQRHEFETREIIRRKLRGTTLLVEGLHTDFEALAIVTWDEAAQQYRWRSYTSRGPGVETELRLVGERQLEWQPNPRMRYRISISEDGVWQETGEATRDDGTTWTQFFGMTVRREPSVAAALPQPFYSVLHESDAVRIVEHRLGPGESEPMHYHPPMFVYFIEGADLRITGPDGTSFDETVTKGSVLDLGAMQHAIENTGDTPLHSILVEFKPGPGGR